MMANTSYMVQLEGCRAIFINHEQAKTPAEAVEVARAQLNAPEAKHAHTQVFKGGVESEVIRG